MIKSFRHAGLGKFFFAGSKAGIQPSHANKLNLQLTTLNKARVPADMSAPGWNLHSLHGDLKGTLVS
jgi:toxin HigB-1